MPKLMKVHLCYPDGSVYCGSWGENLTVSDRMNAVTCKRCIRRFYRYPINAKVPTRARNDDN